MRSNPVKRNTRADRDEGLLALHHLPDLRPSVIFLVLAAAGLFFVKWNPYYHKALLAATEHAIGTSIISGNAQAPPAPSWTAAWGYTAAYFKSVWQAVLLGLILGSLFETLLPGQWLRRFLGSNRFRNTAWGGIAALPSMMCSCCAAPLAVGMRKQSVSTGATLAYWLGNPVLNPATLIFMGFILPWQFLLLRLVIGIAMVFGISFLASRLSGEEATAENILESREPNHSGSWLARWLNSFWRLALDSIPIYLVMVILLGAVRAWLFPAASLQAGNSIWTIIVFAIAGTLFMIPTAAEIPIIQTMTSFGLGAGPAAALLVTLPALSLPSLLMVRNSFPRRVLVFVSVAVIALGVLSGLLVSLLF